MTEHNSIALKRLHASHSCWASGVATPKSTQPWNGFGIDGRGASLRSAVRKSTPAADGSGSMVGTVRYAVRAAFRGRNPERGSRITRGLSGAGSGFALPKPFAVKHIGGSIRQPDML